jgi:hypothetical protein
MKRLVVVILVVLAAMALAPSVASARSAPDVFVRPIKSSPMPAKPMYWKAMWLTRQHPSPVGLTAPMPALQRVKAMRLSPEKLAILMISSKAR